LYSIVLYFIILYYIILLIQPWLQLEYIQFRIYCVNIIDISSDNHTVVPKHVVSLNKCKNVQNISLCLAESYGDIINVVAPDMFLRVAEGFYLVVWSEGKINGNKPRTF